MRAFWLILFAAVSYGQVTIGPITDPYVTTRTVPGTIGTLPVMPTWVNGPLQIGLNRDLYTAFTTVNAAHLTNGFINVNTVTGNDSTCATNTSHACATLNAAVRLKTNSFVYAVCPVSGTYIAASAGDLDYRFSDAGYSGGYKAVIFDKPCHIVFPGNTLPTNTWAGTGGHTNTYQTTITCFSATCGGIAAILRTDQNDGSGFTDEWGVAFPDRLFSATPNNYNSAITYTAGQYTWSGSYTLYQCITICNTSPPSGQWTTLSTGTNHADWDTAGLANLDQLTEGWYFSSLTGVLYVKLNGLDLTNPTNAAKIMGRYYPTGAYLSSGNNPRILVYGTHLFIQNAYLDGVQFQTLQYNNSGTFVTPELWAQGCTVFAAPSYGFQIRGGWSYTQSCAVHANQADGWNGDIGADGTTTGNMECIYCRGTWAGDPHTFETGILPGLFPNTNGVSSHNGIHVDLGGFYSGNVGPEIADTSNAAVTTSQSWFVGTVAENISIYNTGNAGGFQLSGISLVDPTHSRRFWIDSSLSTNETLNGTPFAISVQSGAICKLYNSAYTNPIFYFSANTCTNYTPDAP